jgi:hypothetical protein
MGEDCSLPRCPLDCNFNGRCFEGRCACNGGFYGESCEKRICPNDCSGNGVCRNGTCHCLPGWIDSDCGQADYKKSIHCAVKCADDSSELCGDAYDASLEEGRACYLDASEQCFKRCTDRVAAKGGSTPAVSPAVLAQQGAAKHVAKH